MQTHEYRLKTPWTDQVSQIHPHPEYPRPQFVRKQFWVNLNGPWDFAIAPASTPADVRFDRKILVPFPVESGLSGVGAAVPDGDHIWYRRSFDRPMGARVLLHFGASDFETTAWVNGREVGSHKGGYDPFTFEITNALHAKEPQELVVRVTDPVNAGTQPRGKQTRKPEGIWYTPSSGIWQTVWLEPVPKTFIGNAVIHARPSDGAIEVKFAVNGATAGGTYSVEVLEGRTSVAHAEAHGAIVTAHVPSPRLWSPESPFLYHLHFTLKDQDGHVLDTVEGYTAFREVHIGSDGHGVTRIFLNGKPCLMVGPLDQGFWPDGLYTAPTDDALKYDIEVAKRVGFNMIRKHVKVEPDRWYYWCDKLGMLVWQDMPSGDRNIGPQDPDIVRAPESAAQYEAELKAMIGALRNHPSIVTWIPFNEGWGQFDVARITGLIREYDPARLVDSTTGWADRGVGDMLDEHHYPGPSSPKPEPHRVAVLGEFGGLGLPVPGHTWQHENWGYQSYKTEQELSDAVVTLLEKLKALIASPGLSAAVYTQTTDVETETNGLMTYDRRVFKIDERRLHDAITALFSAVP